MLGASSHRGEPKVGRGSDLWRFLVRLKQLEFCSIIDLHIDPWTTINVRAGSHFRIGYGSFGRGCDRHWWIRILGDLCCFGAGWRSAWAARICRALDKEHGETAPPTGYLVDLQRQGTSGNYRPLMQVRSGVNAIVSIDTDESR